MIDWAFLHQEWFWTAVGTVAATVSIATLLLVRAQHRAAVDAKLAELPPPFISRNVDPTHDFASIDVRDANKATWGLVKIRPVGRRYRIHAVTTKVDSYGKNSFVSMGPGLKATCFDSPASYAFFFVADRDGKPVSARLRVVLASLSRQNFRTTFTYDWQA